MTEFMIVTLSRVNGMVIMVTTLLEDSVIENVSIKEYGETIPSLNHTREGSTIVTLADVFAIKQLKVSAFDKFTLERSTHQKMSKKTLEDLLEDFKFTFINFPFQSHHSCSFC